MSTYQDTLARLQAQMQNHSEMALERLARKIIIALEAQMKDEEIAQELTIEQPHYRNLRRLIQERDWNDRRIGAELDMLDQVAQALGDDYPADTAQNNLSFTCALDYWRELQNHADAVQKPHDNRQRRDETHQHEPQIKHPQRQIAAGHRLALHRRALPRPGGKERD